MDLTAAMVDTEADMEVKQIFYLLLVFRKQISHFPSFFFKNAKPRIIILFIVLLQVMEADMEAMEEVIMGNY